MAALDSGRDWLRRRGLFILYSAFIAGYFVMPTASSLAVIYFLLVLPAGALLWRDILACYRGNLLFALVLAFCLYTLVSTAWSAGVSAAGVALTAWHALLVVSFVAITGYVWTHYNGWVGIATHRLVWLAALAALVSMVAWYMNNPFPDSRLQPLGVMHHENKAACAYGAIVVLATHFFFNEPRAGNKALYYLLSGLLVALVMFTQSRSALAALCAGLLVLVGYRSLGFITVLAAVSFILLASIPEFWDIRVGELSYRPGIWQATLERAADHWLLGEGALADPGIAAYDRVFDHAHNSYLATLRDGGIVGLGLLLAILLVAMIQALRHGQGTGERVYAALVAYGMLCIFMDFDALVTRPRELWLFFWLPVALAMTTAMRPLPRALTGAAVT